MSIRWNANADDLRMRMLGDLEVLWIIATAKRWQCHLDLPALAELLLCSCGP